MHDRLAVVRDHLFGVDSDAAAIAVLRARLIELIGADNHEIRRVVCGNIQMGDSLLGNSFARESLLIAPSEAEQAPAIDWANAFPQIAERGGFDLVIGNPPYLKERNAKDLFDRIARTDIGRRWREARMDLWYYFVHRGLDLLRPRGRLSFIVNSYWTASSGARKLIQRLREETTLEEIVPLDRTPVFADVEGRHLIFRLKRSISDEKCRVLPAPFENGSAEPLTARSRAAESLESTALSVPAIGVTNAYWLTKQDLFQGGRLIIARPDARAGIFRNRRLLGESFDTRQGMAENPPSISPRLARKFGNLVRAGEGVFVLTDEELTRIGFSPREAALVRPYFVTAALGRYLLPLEPTHWVLYLSRTTAPTLEGLPAIEKHLRRFLPILERRRETQRGSGAWWHLHWAREESIFQKPRILSIQMGAVPQFVCAYGPTFVGFSVNLILPKQESTLPLEVLTGILNSSLASDWFHRHAKRRGINLEINARVLRQFPLPGRNEELERKICSAVRTRQSVGNAFRQNAGDSSTSSAAALDETLNHLVEDLYEATAELGASL